MEKITGTVKSFNSAKEFGFISIPGEERDIFFHFSQLIQEGYKTIEPGQEVEFDLVEGEKGLLAQNIVKK